MIRKNKLRKFFSERGAQYPCLFVTRDLQEGHRGRLGSSCPLTAERNDTHVCRRWGFPAACRQLASVICTEACSALPSSFER